MNEERAHEGIEHLQAAAKELIAAARAFLDVAEDLVDDPAPLLAVVSVLGEVAAPFVARAKAATGADGAEAPAPAARVQHIRVS